MPFVHPVDLDEVSPNAVFAARSHRRAALRRAGAGLRAALPPSAWLPLVVLALGCHALLTLTGVGPRSWEARLCAGEFAASDSCRVAPAPGGAPRNEAAQ